MDSPPRQPALIDSSPPTATTQQPACSAPSAVNLSCPTLPPFLPTVSPTASVISEVGADEDEDNAGPLRPGQQNPSGSWQYLTDIGIGSEDRTTSRQVSNRQEAGKTSAFPITADAAQNPPPSHIAAYKLVHSGTLDTETVCQLISRYAQHFHSYFPLVPRKYFVREWLDDFAREKTLLTAVLTIASKDLVARSEIHRCCSGYMRELISDIAAGTSCDVEAVGALLLIAEWEPHGLRTQDEPLRRGEEDRAAWMHVGLAIRVGYFLALDKTSFRDARVHTDEEARKRLTWVGCWISDRLISVRVGRAFWSRGPGPMTGLVSQDFPSLQPVDSADENHASIFQATVELTQIYSNVHDVLYSGMRTSSQMMLAGSYVKYVDDFRLVLLRWKSQWDLIKCALPRLWCEASLLVRD